MAAHKSESLKPEPCFSSADLSSFSRSDEVPVLQAAPGPSTRSCRFSLASQRKKLPDICSSATAQRLHTPFLMHYVRDSACVAEKPKSASGPARYSRVVRLSRCRLVSPRHQVPALSAAIGFPLPQIHSTHLKLMAVDLQRPWR